MKPTTEGSNIGKCIAQSWLNVGLNKTPPIALVAHTKNRHQDFMRSPSSLKFLYKHKTFGGGGGGGGKGWGRGISGSAQNLRVQYYNDNIRFSLKSGNLWTYCLRVVHNFAVVFHADAVSSFNSWGIYTSLSGILSLSYAHINFWLQARTCI